MKPQFRHVSGSASVPRSTAAPRATCGRETRSSQPCQSSRPQNGHAIRASRLRRKSKIRFVASSSVTRATLRAAFPVAPPCAARRCLLRTPTPRVRGARLDAASPVPPRDRRRRRRRVLRSRVGGGPGRSGGRTTPTQVVAAPMPTKAPRPAAPQAHASDTEGRTGRACASTRAWTGSPRLARGAVQLRRRTLCRSTLLERFLRRFLAQLLRLLRALHVRSSRPLRAARWFHRKRADLRRGPRRAFLRQDRAADPAASRSGRGPSDPSAPARVPGA